MKRQYDILICTPFLDKDKDLDLYKESIQLGDGKGWGHWQGARDKAKAKKKGTRKGRVKRDSWQEIPKKKTFQRFSEDFPRIMIIFSGIRDQCYLSEILTKKQQLNPITTTHAHNNNLLL